MEPNVSKAPTSGKVTDPVPTATEAHGYIRGLALLVTKLVSYFEAYSSKDPEEEERDETPAYAPHTIKLGHLLVRDDGALLLSTEDCEDRDLRGREIITCILLTPEEAEFAREKAFDGLCLTAARVASKLPQKAST